MEAKCSYLENQLSEAEKRTAQELRFPCWLPVTLNTDPHLSLGSSESQAPSGGCYPEPGMCARQSASLPAGRGKNSYQVGCRKDRDGKTTVGHGKEGGDQSI